MYAEDKFAEQRYSNQTEAVEARQPQVHESIHALESMVEQHLKMVSELEQRLSPVLRNEPQAAGSNPKETPTAVPIASRINEATARFGKVLDEYRSILRRLEV